MNTRQKLTLGIAAIFMVTLTIVGVTYAYFVTRVVEDKNEGVNAVDVGTATVASIEYVEDDSTPVQMTNIIPTESKTKTFSVKNPNVGAKGTFDIILTSAVPAPSASVPATEVKLADGTIPFIHTATTATGDLTPVGACYEDNAYANRDDLTQCYAGTYYDNITYALYKGTTATGDPIATGRVQHNALAADDALNTDGTKGPQVIATGVEVAGAQDADTPTEDDYIIVFTYEDAEDNQNIENYAALNIKVSIK